MFNFSIMSNFEKCLGVCMSVHKLENETIKFLRFFFLGGHIAYLKHEFTSE